MIKELNLKEIRKALNEGKRFKLLYGKSTVPFDHDCTLIDMDMPKRNTIRNLMEEDNYLYGDINNVITPDKKELLMMLKMFNTAIQFEKQQDVIKSTLIMRNYTDPMNLLKDYYDLPILHAFHSKLKTSIHKLNDEIINLGLTEDLVKISKSYHPLEASNKYFYFDLEEDCKSLKLIRKIKYIPEPKIIDDDLPF